MKKLIAILIFIFAAGIYSSVNIDTRLNSSPSIPLISPVELAGVAS